ncbi:MAG: RidA family protein [Rhodobacteraceae bacterium]|nr:RidA family protein [Paracoccaceae bacterium]MCY4249708.1 RidA family protein [Paracoccaceae bacterium]MCY4309460.1 RidA family protein [Paracoccaceae bacterium]
MVKKTGIIPKGIIKPFANYSHGMRVDGATSHLLISGQLGISRDGVIPETVEQQAEYCFANIEAILHDGGMDKQDVVKITTFVTKKKYLQPYMKIRDEWINNLSLPPASTLYIVSGFAKPEFKIEIEALAIK